MTIVDKAENRNLYYYKQKLALELLREQNPGNIF